MGAKIYKNGSWQDVSSVKTFKNGSWQNISKGKVYRNGSWQDVYPTLPNVGNGILCTYGNKVINNNIVSLGNSGIGENYLYSPNAACLTLTFAINYSIEVHSDGGYVNISYSYPPSSAGYSTSLNMVYGAWGMPLGNTFRGTNDFNSNFYSKDTVKVTVTSNYKIYAIIIRPL